MQMILQIKNYLIKLHLKKNVNFNMHLTKEMHHDIDIHNYTAQKDQILV